MWKIVVFSWQNIISFVAARRAFRRVFAFLVALFLVFSFFSSQAVAFSHTQWNTFLQRYNHQGLVDYSAIRNNPGPLDEYLESLRAVSAQEIREFSREEALAFWINAYHAILIKVVVDHYPVAGVEDIDHFWVRPCFEIAGEQLSLNSIRHGKLIDYFKDERLYCALSYAALGGPLLREEPYTTNEVDRQLHQDVIRFVNDDERNAILPSKDKVKLSMIFKWHAKDFVLNYGTSETLGDWSIEQMAAVSFVAYYIEDREKFEFFEEASYKLEYLDFDWQLNEYRSGK